MPRHSSPPCPPFFLLDSLPPRQSDVRTIRMPTARSHSTGDARGNRSGRLPGGVALAAVVVGAASVGLPTTGAPEADGSSAAAPHGSAGLAAGRAAMPSLDLGLVTSQVLTVPALPQPESPAISTGIAALRKASDRDRGVADRRREDQAQRERSAASETQLTAGGATGGAFARPVSGRLTSSYGSRAGGTHYGLDVANRIGTPIRAAASGVVISAGPASGFGMWVRVRHDDGTTTVYGHINKALVEVGQEVDAGETIAEVGNRGQSTGPHLHFEAHSADGEKLDPGRWLDRRGVGF